MTEMGIGVGFIAVLLGYARHIGLVEALQNRQAEPVKADAGQYKGAGP
jgi:hypothetical protein